MTSPSLNIKHHKTTEIRLKRFILKTLTVDNVTNEYLSWFADNQAKKYIEYASNKHTIQDLKVYVREKENSNNAWLLGIFTKDLSEHIGNIKYEPIDLSNRTAEMGILIGNEDWRGQGVGTEVILGTASWLKKKIGISTITLGVDTKNIQAIAAYEKCGFKTSLEGSKFKCTTSLRMSKLL